MVDWKIYYWGENHEDIKGNHINVTKDEYTATFQTEEFSFQKKNISSSLMSILSASDDVY